MRSIATLSSSLLLLALAAEAQQRPPGSMDERVRALVLAGDDAAAREKALQGLDAYPIANLTSLSWYADRQGPASKEAFRRWLPHRAWIGNSTGTIGDARRRETELLGPDAKREPDGFARGVEKLLEHPDPATRTLALRLLKSLPLRSPEKLLPFLEDSDRSLKKVAAETLLGRVGPEAAGRVLSAYVAGGPETDPAVGRLLASVGGPETAIALLELADFQPLRAPAAIRLVGAMGDASAEPGLLAFLEKTGSPEAARTAVEALGQLGTSASIGPIRKVRDAAAPDDPIRGLSRQALLALRDPALAREIVEDLRAGRANLQSVGGELARLGARDAVPLLVEAAKGKIKIEERNRILESLGRLGGPEDVDRIAAHLDDERHVEAAASALHDLADPRAAGALARALRMTGTRSGVGRALLALPAPLPDVDEPLLEILDDPSGHPSFEDAVRIASRSGSPKLREKILASLSERGWISRTFSPIWELLPLLRPEDRESLLRLRPEGKAQVSIPFQLALAATGDADALRTIVGYAASKRFSLRHPYDRDRMLELPGLGEAVEEAFKTNSGWLEGAEWLALHGNRAGATLLRDHLKTQVGREQASVARALLRLNDPDAREALLAYYERHDPWETPLGGSAEERAFARTLDEAGASRLRDAVVYPSSLRAPLRLLAHRADPTALAFFRSQIRSTTYQTDDLALGLALAGAGAASLRPDFLRMIRSTNASRRIAGAHSLAALGDRNAVPVLVPLLDDLQCDPVVRRAEGIRRGFSSVSEAAAGAIEHLAGREFPGSRANRIEAIRAWSQAEFPKR